MQKEDIVKGLPFIKEVGLIILGSAVFSTSINIFIVPHNLYNPGCTGIAQLIRSVLISTGIKTTFDIAGIINFLLNIPLYILAYKSISRKFLLGTILSIIVQTILFTLIPIPKQPIIQDTLASCVIGGIFSATGIACTLIAKASGGGTDILGIYATMNWKNFSIGKLTLCINIVIYFISAILFDIQVAIYSIIYAGIFSFVLDKLHLQNIQVYCMVFTKNPKIKEKIMHQLIRGLTYWTGIGGYTENSLEVIVTIVTKYEVSQLKKMISDIDPNAFIILSEGTQVIGNFEKRLTENIVS